MRQLPLVALAVLLASCTVSRAQPRDGDDTDLQTIKTRLLASFVPPTPVAAAKAAQDAGQWRAMLQADGSWPDIDYADQGRASWPPNRHLQRLTAMTQALRDKRSPLFESAELKSQTLKALDFWLQRDPQSLNWWHNQIGGPMVLGPVLLLLEADLSPDQKARGVAILDRATLAKTKPNLMTGANLVWLAGNQLLRGVLEPSSEVVADSFAAIFNEIKVTPPGGEGIQPDRSFHQHGPLLYTSGYGNAFVGDTARFIVLAEGTRFAVSPEHRAILESYILDGPAWMIRGNQFDLGARGREITRQAGGSGGTLATAASQLAGFSGPRQAELRALATRLKAGAGTSPVEGNRHFWNSDFMAHQRPGFYVSARMFSNRTLNTDGFINGENKQSHYVSDGANILMRRGDEYRDIFPVWNWRRIPGTTVEQTPAPLDPKKVSHKGQASFVGGVSDGTYGVAAMDLGRDGLTAHKAWFFFDDEYVCLGAGIASASGNPVTTSINQCRQVGGAISDSGPLATGESTLSGAKWVRHDGVNYGFPQGGELHASVGPQTGKWSDIGTGSDKPVTMDVFSLWLDHGAKPQDATYAYIVRPTDAGPPTPGAFEAVEIISNTPDLQAVRQRELKLTGAIFQREGHVETDDGWTLSVDQPCLVLCRQTPDGWQISVSNPENKALTVRVEVGRGAVQASMVFELPGGPEAGRSVTQTVRVAG